MLKQEQIQECQSKFNLSYHVNFAHICQQLVGFENKDVLEVGGSLPPDFVFDYLGVKSWTGIETPDYEKSLEETGGITHTGTIIKDIKNISNCKFNNQPEGKYKFYLENIEDLPEEYYNQYDLIFSIATFEHIHKLPLALDKMFLALKPGGKLFSMFAPIWSAYDGHHLPNLVDKQGKKFHFGDSPIPPWGHLLMSPPEMYSYLCQFTDKETANLMVYYIYHSPHINRLFTEDYLAYINQSSFITDKIDLIFTHPIDLEIKSKLEHFYPGRKYFQNNGILLICGKQEEKNLLQSDQQQPDNIKKEIDIMDNSNLSASSKLICIDLGCGTHKAEGFIGVDVVAADGVDVIANLNGYFPFPDNSVDFIKAHDIIEHLPDRIHTMNEIWRILKPDGIVDISVPSTDGRGAFQDPTHVSFWNINSFMYYCQEFPPYLAGCQSHYGFKGEFSIVSIDEKNSGNQVIQVHAVLKAIKSEENNYPLNLRNINLIIFPDWSQSMEVIFEQLVNLCQAIIDHPKSREITLLIDTQNTNLEDAQFLLADVLLNLCYEENIEANNDNSPEFNLLKTNSPEEYEGLLPILRSRIILENENKELINQIGLEQIPAFSVEKLKSAALAVEKSQLLDNLPNTQSQQQESSLSKAYQKFAEQKFPEAIELFKQTIIENPQFSETGLIPLAHSLILANDWQEISRNLPPGINYLQTSGWLNSLYSGKPINQEAKPIPWYTYPAIEFIENKIDSDFRIFEYGSGNSSLWWSERVTQVISIESDANWFGYIKENMPSNVELYLIEDDLKYASAINQYEDHSFDVIIVDGSNRNQCAEFAISKVKNQGFIIFDNTDDHRHAPGVEKLQASGFIRIDFYGMIPSYLYKNCTSIFFKDVNLLSRGGLPSEKRSCLGRSCFQITSPVIAI
jgi:SAM-dependent methyltransferase